MSLANYFSMLHVDLWNIKDKISQEEYEEIIDRIKVVYVKILEETCKKDKVCKKYKDLLENYTRLGDIFCDLYQKTHNVE